MDDGSPSPKNNGGIAAMPMPGVPEDQHGKKGASEYDRAKARVHSQRAQLPEDVKKGEFSSYFL